MTHRILLALAILLLPGCAGFDKTWPFTALGAAGMTAGAVVAHDQGTFDEEGGTIFIFSSGVLLFGLAVGASMYLAEQERVDEDQEDGR